jgi:hypothetical protein
LCRIKTQTSGGGVDLTCGTIAVWGFEQIDDVALGPAYIFVEVLAVLIMAVGTYVWQVDEGGPRLTDRFGHRT